MSKFAGQTLGTSVQLEMGTGEGANQPAIDLRSPVPSSEVRAPYIPHRPEYNPAAIVGMEENKVGKKCSGFCSRTVAEMGVKQGFVG